MEQFEKQFSGEQEQQYAPHNEAHTSHQGGVGRRTFERDGKIYEEDVLLYEPKERYQDDLVRLDTVIARKKQLLEETRSKLSAHHVTAESPMRLLEDDIARKAAYMKKEIERLEVIRTITLQRLGLLAVQDTYEKGLLDKLSTDVAN